MKSFVDKRRPWQNGVPDWHVGDKLSFQVNWTLWINSIALSSSNHPSSIQNHWSIRSWFPLSPQRHVFQGCISRSAVKSSIVMEASHPITSRLIPPGVLLNGIYVGFRRWTSTNSYLRKWNFLTKAAWQIVGKGRTTIYNINLTPCRGITWWTHCDVCEYGWVFGQIFIRSDNQQNNTE